MAANEKSKELQTFADDLTRASEMLVAEVDRLSKTDENHDRLSHFVDRAMLISVSFQQKLEIVRVDLGKEQESTLSRHTGEKLTSSNDKNITEQLKAQLSRNLEIQNAKLQAEIALRDKLTDMKSLSQQNQQLNEDWISSHRNSLKLLKLLEQKYVTAEKKILTLQKELSKSQEGAKKYKALYEASLQAPKPLPSERAALDLDELRPKTASKAMLSSFRVNDVVRRNECLTQENGDLTREVQRLKRDNSDLLKKAKRSMSDRESILVRLQTSESSKQELYKRLNKEKQKHQSLNRSLTKKASEWIQAKKLIHQLEEDYKWEQIAPISPFGVDHLYNIGTICNGPSYLPSGIASAELYE